MLVPYQKLGPSLETDIPSLILRQVSCDRVLLSGHENRDVNHMYGTMSSQNSGTENFMDHL